LTKFSGLIKTALAGVVILLVICAAIGTLVPAPAYAVVLVDDATKTILAPQCVREWQNTPNKASFLLRRTTMGEAERLNYKLDYECKETGVFSQDGPSLAGLALIKIGWLSPPLYWWDKPYRTEDGIVYPGRKPAN
jgi:hypothetical protein